MLNLLALIFYAEASIIQKLMPNKTVVEKNLSQVRIK